LARVIVTSTPAFLSSVENGQPASARSSRSSGTSSAPPIVICDPTIWCPLPATSSITMRHVSSRCTGGVPASVSSDAIPIVKQPAWAAARSSSGLVFSALAAMRVGSE
jgi:hypothetical protein